MKRKKIKKCAVIAVVAGVVILSGALLHIVAGNKEKQSGQTGIPDVVSSRTENDTAYLTVVANEEKIEDRESFTETVLRMYEENAFYSTRFSEDREPGVTELYISVYLEKSDVPGGEQVFEIHAVFEDGKWNVGENERKRKSSRDGNRYGGYKKQGSLWKSPGRGPETSLFITERMK